MRNITLIAFLFLVSCSGTTNTKKSEVFKAGFKTTHLIDKSRIYRDNIDKADFLYYRPIDMDIWYPTNFSSSDTLIVRNLLGLLEKRANFYSASNAGNGVGKQLAQFFCNAFKCSDSSKLLDYKTNSFKNAIAANGKFPLIIYMAAFGGMSYENFALFEELAEKGFIVISINSIGRFPGEMTMKKQDLMEQVDDAIFSINSVKQNPIIDCNRIGIVGYSWGGLAGAVLASKIPGVHCLVSLEGSEFHHYGYAKEDDADFDTIKNNSEFNKIHLSVPYLRLESSPSLQPDKKDSVYHFASNHIDSSQIFTIDSAQHEDFDCFSLIARKSGNCTINQRYKSASKLTISFLEEHLKNENTFSKTVEEELGRTIKKKQYIKQQANL